MKVLQMETDLTSFPTEMEAEADVEQIILDIVKGRAPQTVAGTPSILLMRPNGTSTEFNQNSSVSGNRITYNVPASCYTAKGKITLALILTNGSQRSTLGLVTIYVRSMLKTQ